VALTMAPVSVVAPLRSTSIVVGSLVAWWWLGEAHGLRRLVGALVVTAGVAALVLG
jgi:drug/metabolite transporter (DMT)-like permease